MNLKKSIKKALAENGQKQKDLATKMGVTPQQVTNWCITGKISQDNLTTMASNFDMTISEFVALGE